MRGAMASKPRRGTLAEAAQVAADLHAGGVRALRAAEELLRTPPRMRSLRVAQARWDAWGSAAKAQGKTLTAWITEACDARLKPWPTPLVKRRRDD